MRIFKCLATLLVSAVLLLNLTPGLCSCYKRIFSFGDSIIDTGNFVHMLDNDQSRYNEFPYGMTFFKNATGRFCDGRVLVDFYGEHCGCIDLSAPNLLARSCHSFSIFVHCSVCMLFSTSLPVIVDTTEPTRAGLGALPKRCQLRRGGCHSDAPTLLPQVEPQCADTLQPRRPDRVVQTNIASHSSRG